MQMLHGGIFVTGIVQLQKVVTSIPADGQAKRLPNQTENRERMLK